MRSFRSLIVAGVVLMTIFCARTTAQDPEFHHLQGGHIEDVFFLADGRGWTAEEGSRIRFTTDGGQTWEFADTEAVEDPGAWVKLNGVFALDLGVEGVKVWAVGERGVVLASIDQDGLVFEDANQFARVTNAVGEGIPCVPVGQLADLQDIYMFDADTGWVIGFDGVLKYTANGGLSWSEPSGFQTPFGCSEDPYDGYRIHFFADSGFDKGIILSEFGKVFLSEDGGLSWNAYSPIGLSPSVCPSIAGNPEFWGIAFDDPDDPDSDMWLSGGIGRSPGYIFKSSGGWPDPQDGNSFSWTQLRTYDVNDVSSIVSGGQCSLSTVYSIVRLASSSVPVVAAGYAGGLFTWETGTANFDPCECEEIESGPSGTAWVQQDTSQAAPDPCIPKAAYFASARVGTDSTISVGDFGRITFFDDGASDETVERGTEHFVRLLDGKFLSSSTGFVAGQRNTILKTTNGGDSWTVVGSGITSCGSSDYINAIDFSDDGQYGVAVGNNAFIAYSDDYGSNWTEYTWPSPPGPPATNWMAVDFAPGSIYVYVVGSGGVVKWSSNGGAYWRSATSPGSEDLYGVSFLNDDVGYACGDSKKIYRTTTGAGSWASITVNGGASEVLRDVQAWIVPGSPPAIGAIAVGDNGRVFQKATTGSTFEQIDDDSGFPADITQALFDVEALDDGATIRICGDDGVVLFRDGTTTPTWTRVRSLANTTLVKLSFQDADEGFAVGFGFFVGRYE